MEGEIERDRARERDVCVCALKKSSDLKPPQSSMRALEEAETCRVQPRNGFSHSTLSSTEKVKQPRFAPTESRRRVGPHIAACRKSLGEASSGPSYTHMKRLCT